jgi:hypothetical protein
MSSSSDKSSTDDYSEDHQGSFSHDSDEQERFEEKSLNSECSDSDDDSGERGRVSSSDSSSTTLRPMSSPERRHKEASQREERRVLQRKLFHDSRGFEFNVDTANAIKRVLKEKIFPKIKILSGSEQDYLTPDFIGEVTDQSRLICEKLIQELDLSDYLQDKILFWITYRKMVKNQLVKFRSNCVEDLKREYFKGMLVGIYVVKSGF